MGARILLNIDLGELPGEPDALYGLAHLAHVACGGHTGDADSMRLAVARCRAHGTLLGAHPSYPDRVGFGRRRLAVAVDALRLSVAGQCASLRAIASTSGQSVEFVKAHGALYHAARTDLAHAEALLAGALEALGENVTVVGPAGGHLRALAEARGIRYAREGFADRAMQADGTLVARDQPGALLLDPARAARQASELASSREVDTICVHGDTPGAVAIARAVRVTLNHLRDR